MFQITLNIILDSEVRLSEGDLTLLLVHIEDAVQRNGLNLELDLNDSNITQEEF